MRKDTSFKDCFGKLFVPIHYAFRCMHFRLNNKKIKEGALLFLGDSITEGYPLKSSFPSYVTVNRGIAGDTAQGILKRIDLCLDIPLPKCIIMLVGINDIGRLHSVEKIKLNYKAILSRIKQKHPQTPLFMLSVLPVNKGSFGDLRVRLPKIKELNQYLSDILKEYDYTFLNLFSLLTESHTDFLNFEYSKDGLHPNDKGYKILTNAILECLNEKGCL